MTPVELILTFLLSVIAIGFLIFASVSSREGHRRAARLGALFSGLTLLVLVIILLSPTILQTAFAILLGVASLIQLIAFFWPARQSPTPSPMPTQQVDERTIMFARARLQPDTPDFKAYYASHPDHLAPDNAFRKNAGLLAPGSAFYNDLLAASPEGSFFLTEALRESVDGPVTPRPTQRSPETFTHFIKGLTAYHGAAATGICKLQPYHLYSHIGRGTGTVGAPVSLEHRFAIAFTVEMDHAMVNAAPRMPTVMESARQYVESAKIAVAVAAAIRALGYPARAHIDGNYRLIAPLVAKDAGLGEIGRMGLLMTPRLGPRVRLAVVTTDLPLLTDAPTCDPTVIDFCLHCSKCAEVCPSQAIPHGDRQRYDDGTLRWKIDAERCYTYWTKIGTDCGRCMAVCPYAHEDNFFHQLIRLGVNRSATFRRAAKGLDDFFYGQKPQPHTPPDWLAPFS